jgi:hypothetical protein
MAKSRLETEPPDAVTLPETVVGVLPPPVPEPVVLPASGQTVAPLPLPAHVAGCDWHRFVEVSQYQPP